MHDDQHHRRRRQVVEVGGKDKRSQRDGPQQALRVAGAYPFGDEVETAIVVQQFHNRHGSQQEHDDSSSLADILQEYMLANKILYRLAGGHIACEPFLIVCGVLVHDKVGTPADVYHPPHCAQKDGNGGLVHPRQMACSYQQIGQNEHRYDN